MALNRRQILKSGAAAAGLGVLPRPVRTRETADIIVIGAGLSGLTAAWMFTEAGFKVIVLEGANRLGGRVFTADHVETRPELGASQVGPSYARVLDAIDRLDIDVVTEDRDVMPFSNHLFGELIRGDDWAASPLNQTVGTERELPPVEFASSYLRRLNPLTDPDDWLDPRFAGFDMSLGQLLSREGVSPAGMHLAELSVYSKDLWSASLLSQWQELTRGQLEARFTHRQLPGEPEPDPGKPWNIRGGTSRLVEAIAGQLRDPVRLGMTATAIEMGDDGVEVRCLNGSRFHGRYAVSAIPFTTLRLLRFSPSPKGALNEAIQTLPYAQTTRAFCVVKEPFWHDDGFEPSLFSDSAVRMFWVLDNHKGAGEYRAVIVLVGGAAMRLDTMPAEDVPDFLLSELARIRPASKGKVDILTWHSWERTRLVRGCRHMFAPGQVTRFAKRMIEPFERLHFAGEHTRRSDYGMEAAMESGERAAVEVLERLG